MALDESHNAIDAIHTTDKNWNNFKDLNLSSTPKGNRKNCILCYLGQSEEPKDIIKKTNQQLSFSSRLETTLKSIFLHINNAQLWVLIDSL
jgi:hypothetical protein